MTTSYSDRYSLEGVRRPGDVTLDQWGNPVAPFQDFSHDYDTPEILQARKDREHKRLIRLRAKIQIAMAQMETICPPIGAQP